ncbi:hypothetical protein CS063_07025 [Sporanaerobium hydrogeniformans]|uniref:Uncharacterized protein n=1 Tax=Sporanaerobium hydrogeniformans TaxID=3072179 RepID=A0AC61DEL7_9FIRM|nr:mechanosensitive ion channel family protein [Sporanaerobium hydrogeniformans]PHV71077.1 hypothetical protein CS063_07025 [Sporanaerobium hydrogeniformans]
MIYLKNLDWNPFIIRLIGAFAFLLFFLLFRKLLRKFTIGLLSKISIKKLALGSKLTEALQKPLDYLFLFTGIWGALCISPLIRYKEISSNSFWSSEAVFSLDFIPFESVTTLYTVVFVSIATWGIYNLEVVYEMVLSDLNAKLGITDNTLLIRFTSKLIRFFTLLIGGAIVLSLLFGDIGGIITGVGLGGVAFAFVSKDALSNILSGALLMMDKPFIIGDWVEVSGIEGIIEDISFRSTRIRTFTQGVVVIPNAKIGNENIINWSRMEKRRVKFNLTLPYHTPLDKIHTCIQQINCLLSAHPTIEQGSFLVGLESLGDYSLNIQVLYFSLATDYASYLKIKETINLRILEICEKETIQIAFPTQTLHVHSS